MKRTAAALVFALAACADTNDDGADGAGSGDTQSGTTAAATGSSSNMSLSGSGTGPGSGGDTMSTTAGADTGSSSGGGGGEFYEACAMGMGCADDLICVPIVQFCSMACTEDGECPAPPEGDAVPTCLMSVMDVCVLGCDGGETCPTGTECQMLLGMGMFCVYP